MISEDDVYKIGYISKSHGLHGEVNFHFTDDVFDTTDCPYLLIKIDGIIVPFYMESYRFRSENVAIVKFVDFDSVEKSQRFIGCDVLFERSMAADSPASDELSLDFFIGYKVVTKNDGEIGEIVDIDTNTENYLFIVEGKEGKEYYIPAQDTFIESIDHGLKELKMSLPDGLLDL